MLVTLKRIRPNNKIAIEIIATKHLTANDKYILSTGNRISCNTNKDIIIIADNRGILN